MKQIKKSTIYDYCESCYHILKEKNKLEGIDTSIGAKKTKHFCSICGQPLDNDDAVYESDIELVESALDNPLLKVICFTAPSVRVAIGDEFGMEIGKNVEGKLVASLKELGFDEVFDMNTSADFTIIEEANEFVERLKENKNLPLFTSCCPGWVNYALKVYPKYAKNLSTAKSPQQMFGALINNYYAKKHNIKSTDMFVVSIVPCLAKKTELLTSGINTNVGLDVDVAITTKELAALIKKRNIDFKALKNASYDSFFGECSGAGAIFGNTGGVMEAVLRTAGDSLSKSEQQFLEYKMVRGLDGIRRAKITFDDKEINVAVVCGLKNVGVIMSELDASPHKYDFIEVMACEGGCIGGPGQPSVEKDKEKVLKNRSKGLYSVENRCLERKAHKNKAVMKVYSEYLGKIGGNLAQKLLHRKFKI